MWRGRGARASNGGHGGPPHYYALVLDLDKSRLIYVLISVLTACEIDT